jgi:hypothetical protein
MFENRIKGMSKTERKEKKNKREGYNTRREKTETQGRKSERFTLKTS